MRIDHPGDGQLLSLRALWLEAFGDTNEFLDKFFAVAYAKDRCRCVTIGGQTAAALYWLDMTYAGGKLAYIYAVATAQAFRGRGLCRQLMLDTHALLKERGYAGAVLVPQDEGLSNMYAGMGYIPGSGIREIRCQAGTPAVSLRPVGKDTYRALRREMLPPEAVRLGDTALDFLAEQAEFYLGDGILLAAVREEDRLNVLELLGGGEAAPGILTALGRSEGRFRLPGDEKDFSMFLPLTEDAPMPGHLGFAFD